MNLLVAALATGAVFFAISYFSGPARAGATRALKRGKRYRFHATVKPPFPDEASPETESFLASLLSASLFGADGAAAQVERVDNFPGETRVTLQATMVQDGRLKVPEPIFRFAGRELVLTGVDQL